MLDNFFSEHWVDEKGNPAGGISCGKGFTISWQNGPLGKGADRKEPNGAFVETVIAAIIDRLNFYQNSEFQCQENANAIMGLLAALSNLNSRTLNREKRDVEGTHEK